MSVEEEEVLEMSVGADDARWQRTREGLTEGMTTEPSCAAPQPHRPKSKIYKAFAIMSDSSSSSVQDRSERLMRDTEEIKN